jgi:hypothetical protein
MKKAIKVIACSTFLIIIVQFIDTCEEMFRNK